MAELENLCPEAEHDHADESAAEESVFVVPAGSPLLTVTPDTDDPADDIPHRVGCRTHLHGWAGAHVHGAVRPRRRAAGRGRPPRRWC
ncbi:hypothetical protein [Actinoplanes sp. RD1]|uniref:hypothetical protein n=1 Tax=Actinoplanes sp. RD1 TaxID=3064538 RepID=UPI0027408D61|nr:hypothetical protein [Actinoplanes sp. RD1]